MASSAAISSNPPSISAFTAAASPIRNASAIRSASVGGSPAEVSAPDRSRTSGRAADPWIRKGWIDRGVFRRGETDIEAMMKEVDAMQPEVLVKLLLDAGADPNAHAKGEWPPLTMAAGLWERAMSDPESVAEEDRNVDPSQAAGVRIARRFSADHDPTPIVRLLIDAGAKRRAGDGVPDPIDVAAYRKDGRARSLTELLRSVAAEPLADRAPGKRDGAPARRAPRF